MHFFYIYGRVTQGVDPEADRSQQNVAETVKPVFPC